MLKMSLLIYNTQISFSIHVTCLWALLASRKELLTSPAGLTKCQGHWRLQPNKTYQLGICADCKTVNSETYKTINLCTCISLSQHTRVPDKHLRCQPHRKKVKALR